MKSRGGAEEQRREEQKREEQKREDQRRERVRRKKMQVREKVGKSRNIVFFQWFVAPEGRKVGSLKRRVRSHLARYEKLHAVLARSTFPSQNVQNTPAPDHFSKLRFELCAPLWREAHFDVKMLKAPHVGATFGRSDVVSRGRRKGLWTLSKVSKTWGFCSISKNDGRRGTFEEDLQRCIFRGRRNTRDMFIRAVRRSGRWFPDRGCLRWFCVTGAALCMTWHHFFRGRRSSLDRWTGKIAKRIGTRPSALHSTFHFWRMSRRIASFLMLSTKKMRKSRRIASFLMLSSAKIEAVSLNCCVFDVVKFKSWRSLAESLRFQACR